MVQLLSKAFFNFLARRRFLQQLASRYSMGQPNSLPRRFIAGEAIEDAINAARAIESRGFTHTLDHLGERVTTLKEADAATRDYLQIIDAVVAAGIGRNLSLKLTQLGLDVDKASTIDNLRRILERAEPTGFFIRIDMENSAYTDVTFEIFETLWAHGYRQFGVVVQAALRRSAQDLQRLNALGARVRLVKGAYLEPKRLAYGKKADVDRAYRQMIEILLSSGRYPAIATHDPAMIAHARSWADKHGVPRNQFEFQMLYGVRQDLQATLLQSGYLVRVYIPFGREWFPYMMRRLGERPANLIFALRGIVHRSGS